MLFIASAYVRYLSLYLFTFQNPIFFIIEFTGRKKQERSNVPGLCSMMSCRKTAGQHHHEQQHGEESGQGGGGPRPIMSVNHTAAAAAAAFKRMRETA